MLGEREREQPLPRIQLLFLETAFEKKRKKSLRRRHEIKENNLYLEMTKPEIKAWYQIRRMKY